MADEKYNGWTNYETWVVKLWIDNDQESQAYWLEQARGCARDAHTFDQVKDGIWTAEQSAMFNLATVLELEHEAQFAEGTARTEACAGVFIDLMGAALGRVHWNEIAANLLEDYADIIGEEPSRND